MRAPVCVLYFRVLIISSVFGKIPPSQSDRPVPKLADLLVVPVPTLTLVSDGYTAGQDVV